MFGGHVAPVLVGGLMVAGAGFAWPPPETRGDAGQEKRRPRLSSEQRELGAELVLMADSLVQGGFGGGDAWLKWQSHFLRAPDGRTYVPFTVEIDEAPEGFQDIGMYVRVTERGDTLTSVERRKQRGDVGFRSGEVPVFVPERQFVAPGTATGGEASVALRMLGEMLLSDQRALYPFEDFHFFELPSPRPSEPRVIRRAAVLPAGSYDLYVAIREARSDPDEIPRAAMLKRTLEVPDFSTPALSMSSIVIADEIDVLGEPLTPAEQIEQPYALGTADIVPARTTVMRRDEPLSVFFMIYNAASDRDGRPRVTVDYLFLQQVGVGEEPFTRTRPQELTPETLPEDFDLRQGHQLAPSQSVPLESFSPGPYRLVITVTDELSQARAMRDLRFTVVE